VIEILIQKLSPIIDPVQGPGFVLSLNYDNVNYTCIL